MVELGRCQTPCASFLGIAVAIYADGKSNEDKRYPHTGKYQRALRSPLDTQAEPSGQRQGFT